MPLYYNRSSACDDKGQYDCAIAYQKLRQHDNAIADFREAIELAVKSSNSSNQSLEMLIVGDHDRAMELARTAVNEHPDDWLGHYALGQCLRWASDFSQAAEALERANNLHPGDPSVATALAIARQLDGDLEGAISALREALSR